MGYGGPGFSVRQSAPWHGRPANTARKPDVSKRAGQENAMCQLNVRLILRNNQEEMVPEVTHIAVQPDKITLSSLFAPPRDLMGFQVVEINCLRNVVILTQRAPV